MFGISSSLYNEIGSEVEGWLKKPFNQSFFFWYFIPAAGFVILQLVIIGPQLGYPPPSILSGDFALPTVQVQGETERVIELILNVLGKNLFALVIVPLLLAVALAATSGSTLRLYQGTLPIVRRLMAHHLEQNQQRSDALFDPLRRKRREYRFLASSNIYLENVNGKEVGRAVDDEEREQLLERLKQEIQFIHEKYEGEYHNQDLPISRERVASTALGNVLAAAEEYPFERYGIDAVVFWPRLRIELEDATLAALDNTFTTLTGLLSISLLSYVFVGETVLVWLRGLFLRSAEGYLIAIALVAMMVGIGAYRAAVSAARTIGNLLRTAFDYHRGRILDKFNLNMPDDIEEEYKVWLKLAAFVRRGESFYYPTEWRKSDKK